MEKLLLLSSWFWKHYYGLVVTCSYFFSDNLYSCSFCHQLLNTHSIVFFCREVQIITVSNFYRFYSYFFVLFWIQRGLLACHDRENKAWFNGEVTVVTFVSHHGPWICGMWLIFFKAFLKNQHFIVFTLEKKHIHLLRVTCSTTYADTICCWF